MLVGQGDGSALLGIEVLQERGRRVDFWEHTGIVGIAKPRMTNKLSRLGPLAAALLVLGAGAARAQSYCASDGVAPPAALVERFINADCEACWREAGTVSPRRGELALDWIVPGGRGDDAPLASVARRDGIERLESLGRPRPLQADALRHRSNPPSRRLRVAHGLPFNGYVGASIELKPATGGPWTAWLVLVETLPPGIEDSPVERNLVRNSLRVTWAAPRVAQPKDEPARLFESRPMALPEGVRPERLRVVGWVEDARGRVAAASYSRCP